MPKYTAKGVWGKIKLTNVQSLRVGLPKGILIGSTIVVAGELYKYFTTAEEQRDLSNALVAIGTGIAKDSLAYFIVLGILGSTAMAGLPLFLAIAGGSILLVALFNWIDEGIGVTNELQTSVNSWQN